MKIIATLGLIVFCAILSAFAQEVPEWDNMTFPIIDEGKYHMVDITGNILTREYDYMCKESLWPFALVKENGKYGVISTKDQIIIPFKYKSISFTSTSIFAEDSLNMIDIYTWSGELCNKEKIDEVYSLLSGLIIKRQNKFGIISESGKILLPLNYDYISQVNRDNCCIMKKNKLGIYNITLGRISIPLEYDKGSFEYFFDSKYICKRNNKYGIIDIYTGKALIPCEYDAIRKSDNEHPYWCEGEATILKGRKWYLFYKNKIWPIGYYENAKPIGEGFVEVTCDNSSKECGLVNKNGEIVFPLGPHSFQILDNDLICVKQRLNEYLCGCINFNGKICIPIKYASLFKMKEQKEHKIFCVDAKTRKLGIIDYQGNSWISSPMYDYSSSDATRQEFCKDGSFFLRKNGKYGMIDVMKNEIIPFEYEDMRPVFLENYKWFPAKKTKNGD